MNAVNFVVRRSQISPPGVDYSLQFHHYVTRSNFYRRNNLQRQQQLSSTLQLAPGAHPAYIRDSACIRSFTV